MYTVKTQSKIAKLWTCPQCGRLFERKGQVHSCRSFPLERHFERKPAGKNLYEKLKEQLKQHLGEFKVESLECCIHFVSTFTFAAVKILRDKVRVDFSLSRQVEHPKISHIVKMSAHRYLHFVEITKVEDIDEELMEWIREAHDMKGQREKQIIEHE